MVGKGGREGGGEEEGGREREGIRDGEREQMGIERLRKNQSRV